MEGPIYRLEQVVKARQTLREDFIGPLDLILHLLGKNKMEIRDIQISFILDQYLEWMNRRKELDLEVASEFVTMASHLTFIKSRMLLSVNDQEVQSEMKQLIASLEARQYSEQYTQLKALLPELEQRARYGMDRITRSAQPLEPDRTYHYVHEKEELFRAITQVLERTRYIPTTLNTAFQGIVGREPYPVDEKAEQILYRVKRMGNLSLDQLFQDSRSRSEVVATFLAVLELCKARQLSLSGEGENCLVSYTNKEPEFTEEVRKHDRA